jgi:hypothetical protein
MMAPFAAVLSAQDAPIDLYIYTTVSVRGISRFRLVNVVPCPDRRPARKPASVAGSAAAPHDPGPALSNSQEDRS